MSLRKRIWQFIVISMAVALGLSIYADFDNLVNAFQLFDWRLVPLILGLTLGNQFFRFLKWEYLLGKVDVDLPISTSFHIFGSGLIMIMTPGKLGEIWKSWLVKDIDGTPISTTLPVVATERITDLLGVVTISLLGVVALDRSPLILLILLVPIIAGVLLLQHERACHWILNLMEQIPVIGHRAEGLHDLYESSRELLHPRPLGITTSLSIISWGLECIGMWLVLSGFGVEAGVLVAAFVFAISSILGALSLLPGGLGVTEGSMVGLLLVFGVDRALAASSTLVIRAATLWFVAGLALLVYGSFKWHHSMDITQPEEKTES